VNSGSGDIRHSAPAVSITATDLATPIQQQATLQRRG
jgi:hypothetical protein